MTLDDWAGVIYLSIAAILTITGWGFMSYLNARDNKTDGDSYCQATLGPPIMGFSWPLVLGMAIVAGFYCVVAVLPRRIGRRIAERRHILKTPVETLAKELEEK